jgi:hypothetical protein
MAYLEAKEQAAKHLMRNAARDYSKDLLADWFPGPEVLAQDGKVGALQMFERYARSRYQPENIQRLESQAVGLD